MEVINWKENKEVGTICFEVRIPMKKNILEFFYVSLLKKPIIFGLNNFILEHFYSIKTSLSNKAYIVNTWYLQLWTKLQLSKGNSR